MTCVFEMIALAHAKQIFAAKSFSSYHSEGTREHALRSSLSQAAMRTWGTKFEPQYAFKTEFENFLGEAFGIFGGFILEGRFAHLIVTKEDGIALLDLFGDFKFRAPHEVPGSREQKELIKHNRECWERSVAWP